MTSTFYNRTSTLSTSKSTSAFSIRSSTSNTLKRTSSFLNSIVQPSRSLLTMRSMSCFFIDARQIVGVPIQTSTISKSSCKRIRSKCTRSTSSLKTFTIYVIATIVVIDTVCAINEHVLHGEGGKLGKYERATVNPQKPEPGNQRSTKTKEPENHEPIELENHENQKTREPRELENQENHENHEN